MSHFHTLNGQKPKIHKCTRFTILCVVKSTGTHWERVWDVVVGEEKTKHGSVDFWGRELIMRLDSNIGRMQTTMSLALTWNVHRVNGGQQQQKQDSNANVIVAMLTFLLGHCITLIPIIQLWSRGGGGGAERGCWQQIETVCNFLIIGHPIVSA